MPFLSMESTMAAHELTMGNPRTFVFINELTARWRFALTVVVQALRAMLTLVGESSACFASRQFRTHFLATSQTQLPSRSDVHALYVTFGPKGRKNFFRGNF